ncbi:MAG: hypothetical protein JWM59_3402 [Verrucomicrobiales bacterium]|nr:hypothetical protein [Verrucomicrobiales bacterium]
MIQLENIFGQAITATRPDSRPEPKGGRRGTGKRSGGRDTTKSECVPGGAAGDLVLGWRKSSPARIFGHPDFGA